MTLSKDSKLLAVAEKVASQVIRPEALPGIDISPLIDALMQFLLQLVEDCPKNELQKAADQSAKRPLIRMWWRGRLNRRLPKVIVDQLPDAAADLLDAGANLSPAQWAALGD
jgi:hypothetical protein